MDLPPNHCSEPLEVILKNTNVCKNTYYQIMILKLEFQRTHIKKWDAIFGKEISNLDWELDNLDFWNLLLHLRIHGKKINNMYIIMIF